MKVPTPSTGATTTCGMVAPSAVRPVSLPSSLPPLSPQQRTRRGLRSAAARLRRAEAWRAHVVSRFSEPSLGDVENPRFRPGLGAEARPAEECANHGFLGADGTVFKEDPVVNVSRAQGDDNANVSAGICDKSSPGRSSQSGPTTQSISDNFCVFHLNVQCLMANLAEFDALIQQVTQPARVATTET